MLTITTYTDSVEQLTDFVNRTWSDSYAGHMTFPCWTPSFFEWQLRLNADSDRQNLIAAYDGATLAAVLLGTSFPYRFPDGRHLGSQWSWLSIHPEYRNRGIAKALDHERIERQKSADSRLIVSYRYFGSKHSLAERPHHDDRDRKFNRKVGFWARVIDPARFAAWHWSKLEGCLARLASPFTRIPKVGSAEQGIRSFEMSDLDACVELAKSAYGSSKLSIEWDHDALRHQLAGSGICQTVVIQEHGTVTGFVNYHLLPFRAKSVQTVAVIDLIVLNDASAQGQVRLLNAALSRMQDDGAILALKVRCGDTPAWPLLRTHFVPQPADSHLVFQAVTDPIDVPSTAAVHLLWR